MVEAMSQASATHARSTSSGGIFGDFVTADATQHGFDPTDASAPGDVGEPDGGDFDEWREGSTVQSFSPLSPPKTLHVSAASFARETSSSRPHAQLQQPQRYYEQQPRPPPPAPSPFGQSSSALKTEDLLDWDAWESKGPSRNSEPEVGSSSAVAPSMPALTSADEAFFASLDRAAVAEQERGAPRPPSPPMIDLREVERKLDAARAKAQALPKLRPPPPPATLHRRDSGLEDESRLAAGDGERGGDEDDFFAAFERAPAEVMRSKAAASISPGLEGDQLSSMGEAQATPLDVPPARGRAGPADYFGGNGNAGSERSVGEADASTSPISRVMAGGPSPSSQEKTGSWGEAAGQWAGSLKRTFGSLRGMSADFMSHLPSKSDFIVPAQADEAGVTRGKEAASEDPDQALAWLGRKTHPADENRPPGSASGLGDEGSFGIRNERDPTPGPRIVRNRIARAEDYSHGTPFGPGPSSPASLTSPRSWGSDSHSPVESASSARFASARRTSRLALGDLGVAGIVGGSGGHAGSGFGSISSSSMLGLVGPTAISGAPGFDAASTKRWNTGDWRFDVREEAQRARRPIDVELVGRKSDTFEVVDKWHASRLQAALPPRLQLGRTWRLLYSLDQHGTSLGTLYDRVKNGMDPNKAASWTTMPGSASDSTPGFWDGESTTTSAEGWLRGASSLTQSALGAGARSGVATSPAHGDRAAAGVRPPLRLGTGLSLSDAGVVVAIRDAEDHVFGAFVNERLRAQSHYYGNGECFLWKTARVPTAASSSTRAEGQEASQSKRIVTYRWTGRNDYMALTEAHYLSFGGGDSGHFGLWLDERMEKGVSSRCAAFNNDVLCDEEPPRANPSDGERERQFECMGVEVWAVGVD